MANEKGVWRTIGGRRVFIKEGQDLASAMKESGKFKSASKGTAKKEMKKEEKVFEDFKNSDGSKENFEKALNKISEMEYNNEINPDEYKDYISKIQKEYVEKNRKAGEENDLDKVKRIQGDLDKKGDKLTKEEKAWKEQLANTQKELESGKSREDIIKDLDREALRNTEKEYGELSKKMQADDYYYKPEDDRKLKELRAKADSERARQGIDTQEKYDKLMSEDSDNTDLNKFNDKAKAKFGKIDYNGTGRKVNEVEIEMELKDGVFSASGAIKNARGTDWLSGGQNIDEIADMMKDNKDVQEIRDLWHKYHLNDMHAGTEKQEDALMKKFGNRNASDYDKHVEYLKSVGLYEDDGYKYGTGWLKREIPDDDKRRIISLIDKYNGKNKNTETSNKTTNQSMNDTLRNAFNDYRKKHKNSNMSFTEFMRMNKK